MHEVKKVKIFTYGCQMNVYDSQRLAEHLCRAGYEQTETDGEADLIILNTCSVRENPAQKVFSKLGRLRKHKKRGRDVLFAVAGCVAQQEQEALARRVPYVDIVLGPDHVGEIVELVEQAQRTGRQVVATTFKEGREVFPEAMPLQESQASAFVTVMKGCNQYCAYCIVPYTRGREISKPADEVVAEVGRLVNAGVKEVTLLGQNVNRYGMGASGYPRFHELLAMVGKVEGLERLRFLTSHPADCTEELISAFGTVEKLCPYLHFPLQAGSDRILSKMNRRYSFEHYSKLVDLARSIDPAIHLSTDLIVGFPGETDADFEATLDAARTIKWGSAYSFKYSPRPGTAAADLTDDVPGEVKKSRLSQLQAILYAGMTEALRAHVGSEAQVLVEARRIYEAEDETRIQLTGRTATNYVANFPSPEDGDDLVGKLVRVRITGARTHSLMGEMAGEPLRTGRRS